MKNLVVGIYFHPEAYPPTLNAVGELSECFDHITILHRPHLIGTWRYPANVTAIPSGTYITSIKQERSSLLKKVLYFFQFTSLFLLNCKKRKPAVILVYDNLSLLAYFLVRPFLHKHKIWYHNHDVTEPGSIRKYSIGWFASRQESRAFKYLDIFSLPANERKKYFPMESFRKQYFFIPNYPAKRFYSARYLPKSLSEPLRLIFQGSIGPYHGIEEIIPLLRTEICGYRLELVLKGPCRDEYRRLYNELATKHQVLDRVQFMEVTPYADVPAATASCHIGIGILAKQDIMNNTLGTASNKLYEYAALGLPVIFYKSENMVKHLCKYKWAIPADVQTDSIKQAIEMICMTYPELSSAAHEDFSQGLNFEKAFSEVKKYLVEL